MTAKRRIGIWLIGCKGGVAIATIVGLVALKKGLASSTGLVSQLPEFARLGLASWDDFVIGGHEIRGLPLCREAYRVTTEMRAASTDIIDQCRDELQQIEARIRPGTVWNVGATIASLADVDIPRRQSPRQIVDRLKEDLQHFRESERLDHVIVVNVASTEPPAQAARSPHAAGPTSIVPLPASWAELEPELKREDCPLPASSLYAIAALDVGDSYINFTPSLGAAPAAIDELACLRGSRHAGCVHRFWRSRAREYRRRLYE